jgi:hypothetical protein
LRDSPLIPGWNTRAVTDGSVAGAIGGVAGWFWLGLSPA